MNGKKNGSKQSIMSLIDKKVFFPGVIEAVSNYV